MKFILGQKKKMTQVWENDKVVAVTAIEAKPCVISDIKTQEKDGYKAIQVAQGERKEKNIKKPQLINFKKLNILPRYLKEFRVKEIPEEVEAGKKLAVDTFSKGDKITITGISKGRGFQGVVKRHGFGGARKTHGTKDQLRMPGSIGATAPAHVFKGKRMPGHMGNEKITISNLDIVDVDTENNLLYIKGSVPGCTNGLLMIKGEGELKLMEEKQEVPQEEKPEEESSKQETPQEEKTEAKEEKQEEKPEEDK